MHHKLEELLDEYLKVSELGKQPDAALFPIAVGKTRELESSTHDPNRCRQNVETPRKGDNAITIGLHPDLADWIAQNAVGDDPRGFIFPSLANRSGAGRNGLSKYFEGIMKKAKIEGRLLRKKDRKGRAVRSLSFHSFRHGAASAAFKGAALKHIARSVTGHAARGVVDRYIHIDVEAVKAATNLIPRLPKS